MTSYSKVKNRNRKKYSNSRKREKTRILREETLETSRTAIQGRRRGEARLLEVITVETTVEEEITKAKEILELEISRQEVINNQEAIKIQERKETAKKIMKVEKESRDLPKRIPLNRTGEKEKIRRPKKEETQVILAEGTDKMKDLKTKK